MAQSRLTELASTISSNTAIFNEHFALNNLPAPSFDLDTPLKQTLPDDILRAREKVLDATSELQALMLGPVGNIRHQINNAHGFLPLHIIYRFGIARSFPVDGEATYPEISKACGLSEPEVRRTLRYAMTHYVFKEPRKGVVAHTASSKALAEIPFVNDWVGLTIEDLMPAACRTADAMMKWPGSQEPNHSGFAIAYDTKDPAFVEISKSLVRAKRFGNAMTYFDWEQGFEHHHLVDAFSWDSVKTFVDMGGSHGVTSIALAIAIPTIQCIVQDFPKVVAEGSSLLPKELVDRVKFAAHDIFTEQPVKGADVYHFRWIFHCFSDKNCIKMLRSLIPALAKGSRIIVSEFVLPPPGGISAYAERFMRSFDLWMLEMSNSKERDEEDWVELFKSADEKFKFIGIKRPSGSELSFIEVEWKGASGLS